MGLLQDNSANYKNASLLAHAEKIRNKKYMLIHGTYDDNVHYQQSMMLSYELERRVILFRQQVSILKIKLAPAVSTLLVGTYVFPILSVRFLIFSLHSFF